MALTSMRKVSPTTVGNCAVGHCRARTNSARSTSKRLVEENGGNEQLPGAVPLVCNAGDVTIVNRQMVHGSFANSSPDLRISLTFGFHRRKSVLGQKAALSITETNAVYDGEARLRARPSLRWQSKHVNRRSPTRRGSVTSHLSDRGSVPLYARDVRASDPRLQHQGPIYLTVRFESRRTAESFNQRGKFREPNDRLRAEKHTRARGWPYSRHSNAIRTPF